MEFEKLLDGTTIPALGLGTWLIGGTMQSSSINDERDVAMLREAISLGYSHIDTAEAYGDGHCEELIGEAIRGIPREKLFLASKVFKTHLAHDDVLDACAKSLKRLRTSYLDLYLIHSPNPDIPLKGTIEAMSELVKRGLVRRIGVSNFPAELLAEAQSYTSTPIMVNQIEYNLMARNQGQYRNSKDMESKIIPYCRAHGIVVCSMRPIERGVLAKEGHSVLDALATKYSKTQAQISLNWLLNKPGIIVIVKSTDPAHLRENLEAQGWSMSPEDIALLDRADFSTLTPAP